MKKFSFLVALMCASVFAIADPIASEYCGEVMKAGTNQEAAFSWETTDDGSVVITISATQGEASATHFRGNGITISKIKVGESKEDAATYFNHACGGSNKVTLSLKDPNNAPALGTKIYVDNQVVEYATSKDGNAWPSLTFEYTYGGVCSHEQVLTRISLSASATFAKIGDGVTLTAVALDKMGEPMDVSIDLTVDPADAGSIVDNVYKPAKAAAATITAKSGDISSSITVYGVPSDNLALNQPCVAGFEPANQGEISSKANDGNVNTQWVDYAGKPLSQEWWYVDLGAKYTVTAINVVWGDPASTQYILQARTEAPDEVQQGDDEAWETITTVNEAGNNSEQFVVVNATARYIRLHSQARTADYVRLKEVRVFGTEWVPLDDNEKPVMVSAELVSATWKSAVIAVSATDNIEVAKYHVVDAVKGIDTKLTPTDGKITLAGLTATTAYNFTITAIDAAGLESDNNKVVAVATKSNVPEVAAPTPTWPAKQVKSIYSDAYDFAPASLVTYNAGWWNEPEMTERANGEDHFLDYNLYRGGMIGAQFATVSVASMEKTHIDIYASAAGTVTFRWITDGDPGSVNDTRKTLTLEADKWNSFDIDLADFGDHNWANLFQFSIENYEAGGLVGEHISVDNIYLYRTTELVDNEKPTNAQATLTSTDIFSAVITASAEDNSGAVIFDVKNGDEVLASSGGLSGANVVINVPGLLPNTDYNLSVVAKDEAGNAADPVAVSAKTLAAPAPAPTPDFTGKEAVAVFCDALDGGPAINIGGWGQTTQAQLGQLAANDYVWYGTNFNYLGWELAPSVIATGMTHLHADFYTVDMQSISITPISPGKEGIQVVELTANAWTSADIDLANYEANAIDWSNIFQMKFFNAAPAAKALFIDNVYFYKSVGTGVENIDTAAPAQKFMENGSLYILRDGVVYTIQGAVVR